MDASRQELMNQQSLPLNGKRILIVDDDEDVLSELGTLLEVQGWSVEKALDGNLAMKRLLNTNDLPDVILLDYEMPQENGIRFWNELNDHQELCYIPTIMMSAAKIPIKDIPGIKAMLPKPINSKNLLQLLEEALMRNHI